MTQVETFNQYRPLMLSVAYRMLGSVMDAEDIVQEAFLRWSRTQADEVQSAKAYLSTIVTRLCIDQLRSAQAQREVYVGPWLPEPLLTEQFPDVADTIEKADSLSLAFLVVLESLSPVERAVFLLREIFDYDYPEVAQIVGKSEANCRQMVHRARQHLVAHRPRFDVSPTQREKLTRQFFAACTQGDLPGLIGLLTEDIVLTADGGGKASAATRPVYGPNNVARFVIGLAKKAPAATVYRFAQINGQPGLLYYVNQKIDGVMVLDIVGEQIRGIQNVRNPDKLRAMPAFETH